MSARIWHGWYSLVSPLITGTRELAAKRSMIFCSKVRIITISLIREMTVLRILDRLAAPQLGIAGIQVDRRAAQLLHAGLERQPRPRAGLLENHHQCAVGKRPVLLVRLELVLDPPGARKT